MNRKTTLTNEQIELVNQRNQLSSEEAWNEFLTAKEMLGVTSNTKKHYETARRVTYRDLPIIDIENELLELNRKDIESLISYWKTVVKVPTVNSRIRVLKTFYATLKQRKIIQIDPMKEIHQLKEKEVIKETLTENEIAMIAKYFKSQQTFAQYRNLVVFELLLDTGLRISEALAIRIHNIMEDHIIINETKSKNQIVVFPSTHCLKSTQTYIRIRVKLIVNIYLLPLTVPN